MPRPVDTWLAAGVRTPFAKVDGPLAAFDAIELSVPVARHMAGLLKGGKPDFDRQQQQQGGKPGQGQDQGGDFGKEDDAGKPGQQQ